MLLEQQTSGHASFLTLTFAASSVPQRLEYADISSFLKRFRKNTRASVRFFCVGEYGERTNRPHWHLIMYTEEQVIPFGLTHVPEWPHGGCLVGDATAASMAYVAGYTLKKRYAELLVRMSRRPGLGLARGCQLADVMAQQVPEIETFPTVLRVGKHLYPMHRTLRDVMQERYVRSGGVILRPSRVGMSLDFEAAILVRNGDNRASQHRTQVSIERTLTKDHERVPKTISSLIPGSVIPCR